MPPAPDCEGLVDPIAFASARDAVDAATWTVAPTGLYFVLGYAWESAEDSTDPACPEIDVEGERWSIRGNCTTPEGVRFAGTLVYEEDAHGSVVTFEAFEYEWPTCAMAVSGDGTVGLLDDGGEFGHVEFVATGFVDPVEGSFVFDLVYDAGTNRTSGYVWARAPAVGPAGDFCTDSDVRRVDGCDEGEGYVRIQGARTAVITEDGATDCDACSPVTLDGTPSGEVCE